jgi:hypothetical protein
MSMQSTGNQGIDGLEADFMIAMKAYHRTIRLGIICLPAPLLALQ